MDCFIWDLILFLVLFILNACAKRIIKYLRCQFYRSQMDNSQNEPEPVASTSASTKKVDASSSVPIKELDALTFAPTKEPDASTHIAFAKVFLVSAGSPAETAGLKVDDQIIEFGSVNATNFKDFKQISEIVKNQQNQEIALKIRRRNELHELILIPKAWSDCGLMGCNILVIDNGAKRFNEFAK